jgi:tetratricopeptide (TPR) repeat protein
VLAQSVAIAKSRRLSKALKDLLEKKEYLRAMESFEKAVELNPNSPEVYYFRGLVQLDRGKADADFTKAIELKPDYAEAYFQRGLGRDLGGNDRMALTDYNKASCRN